MWFLAVGVVAVAAIVWWFKNADRPSSVAMAAQEPTELARNPLLPIPHIVADQTGTAQIKAVWKINF